MKRQALIATLGTEPQVVTLALDLLRAKGYPITEVVVVHTAGQVIEPALRRLQAEFARELEVHFRTVGVEDERGSVEDVGNEADATAVLRTIYRTVLEEKRAGRLVHLSIAGGRKPMAVYGMVAAQLLFNDDDRAWHLLSEGWQPGEEQVMHPRPEDRVWLVPVPVLRWGVVSPMLTELARRDDPWDAIRAQRELRRRDEMRAKREFVEHHLTKAEREVMQLACRGWDNAAIARRLGKAEKTVANQLTSIYAKLHEWRGFREDIPVSRAVLVAEFAGYFSTERR